MKKLSSIKWLAIGELTLMDLEFLEFFGMSDVFILLTFVLC